MRTNWKLIGYTVQAVTIVLGINIIYNGYAIVGLLLAIGSLTIDLGLVTVRRDYMKASAKLLLFLHGVMLWIVFINPGKLSTHNVDNVSLDASIFAKTRRIIPVHMHKRISPSPHEKRTRHEKHFEDSEALSVITKREQNIPRSILPDEYNYRNETMKDTADKINQRKTEINKDNQLLSQGTTNYVNHNSISLLTKIFGNLPVSDFDELKFRNTDEVRSQFAKVFRELPPEGFSSEFKNPCWKYPAGNNLKITKILENIYPTDNEDVKTSLACLPYAYVLGQPKCGTSDLYERLKRHPEIR